MKINLVFMSFHVYGTEMRLNYHHGHKCNFTSRGAHYLLKALPNVSVSGETLMNNMVFRHSLRQNTGTMVAGD